MTEQEWREKFVNKLKLMMMDMPYTKKEFAKRVGISETALNNYLNGIRTPSTYIVRNMAKVLECDMDELVNFERFL